MVTEERKRHREKKSCFGLKGMMSLNCPWDIEETVGRKSVVLLDGLKIRLSLSYESVVNVTRVMRLSRKPMEREESGTEDGCLGEHLDCPSALRGPRHLPQFILGVS